VLPCLSDDALAAIKQAETMAEVWEKDVAILPDLTIVKLEQLRGGIRTPKVLEIIRSPSRPKKQ
jgi:hypothetical protein